MNYGVGGYGTDQSVLRFISNNDKSTKIILGIYPEDLKRNLTSNLELILSRDKISLYSFKPKFEYKFNELKLIPIPVKNYNDYKNFKSNYAEFMHGDFFIKNHNFKQFEKKFPYSLVIIKSMFRNILNRFDYLVWNGFLPDEKPFWLRNLESINLNNKIIELFFQTCNENSQECNVLIIPDLVSINYFLESKININKKIYEDYYWSKNTYDTTEWLANKMSKNGVCNYYGKENECYGHFNLKGNELLSEYIIKFLIDN